MRALGLATRHLKALDHTLARTWSDLQVLVDVRTPMNLAVLKPVWTRLQADPRITMSYTAEDTRGVEAALRAEGLAEALVPRDDVRWRRFDLSLSADAWNHAPLSRCRSRMNFFHGVAGKYDLDDPARIDGAGLRHFDRIAFINADRLERWVSAGLVSPSQAVLVGYPKLDDVLNGQWDRGRVLDALGLDPSRDTVLYAPTFSVFGSLHAAGLAIVDAVLASGRNLVVKLHDRSLVPSIKYTGGVNWRARLQRYEQHPRFALADGPDAGPLLAASDVLVTDHSSVGFEFALLDRPLVVFDAPELQTAARIAADKWTLLRSMADVVRTADALGPAIDFAVAHREHRRAQRSAARELFAYPGRATERALGVVYELLQVPGPVGVAGRDAELHAPGLGTSASVGL